MRRTAARHGRALRRWRRNARGRPGLYHETITVAYLLWIHEGLAGAGRSLSWTEFADRHAELLSWKPSILDRYYRPDTLTSDRARRTFVLPDRLA